MEINSSYKLVSNKFNYFSIEENTDTVTISFSCDDIHIINIKNINCFTDSSSNSFYLNLIYANQIYSSCNLREESSILDFNDQLEDLFTDEDIKSPYEFKLNIRKVNTPGKVIVYSIDSFASYLSQLSLTSVLRLFHNLKGDSDGLIFQVIDRQFYMLTPHIVFTNLNDYPLDNDIFREEIIRKSQFNINKNGNSTFDFLPDDFSLIKRSNSEILNGLFDRLCILLCFIYISNYSEINNDELICKLVGYKTINLILHLKSGILVNKSALTSYYNMYTWIYQSESQNVADKCGICRNILSLYLSPNNAYTIEEDLYSYVLSCNEIYLKENINKYIEVKGNVLNLLNDINVKLFDVSKSFSNKLRNNLLALITFYFTTLLMNTISTGKISNIFTKDIATISYAFIICSLVYYFISLFDYIKEKNRYKSFYYKQKNFYSDILIDKEIEDIFLKDEPFHQDINDIWWTGVKYTVLWFLSITLAIIIITYLSGYSPTQIISEIYEGVK